MTTTMLVLSEDELIANTTPGLIELRPKTILQYDQQVGFAARTNNQFKFEYAGEISSDTSNRSNENITINGVSLAGVVQAETRADIRAHLQHEQSKLAAQCGLRRTTSRRRALGRGGRPSRVISIVLANKLKPFLKDDKYSLTAIAEQFELSIGAVHAYMKWLGVTRKSGRKSDS